MKIEIYDNNGELVSGFELPDNARTIVLDKVARLSIDKNQDNSVDAFVQFSCAPNIKARLINSFGKENSTELKDTEFILLTLTDLYTIDF